ncbi:MAG: ATP-dependent zinc metalloprotease FtsH [Planctomycetes bacterium]|nr:ATP-dependent zinc metalloprotease FtsH [Planctomycetota bacterium]
MPPTGPPGTPESPPPPTRKASPIMAFAVILGALLLISLFATWLFVPAQKSISYDKYLGLVDRGQIAKLTLVGGTKIQGEVRDQENDFVKDLKLSGGRFSVTLPHIDNFDPILREIREKDYKANKEAIDAKEKQPVQINPEEDQSQWVGPLLWGVLPMVLILLFFFFFLPRMRDPMGGAYSSFVRSPARRYEKGKTRTTFEDVAGMDHAKKELQEVVEFLKTPEKFHRLGAQVPKGVLLVGPPGTGKTLLARAVAGEAGVPFYSINGSEFIQMFVGVGATRVRDLFRTAKENAPCLIFIDEIDAVGRMRGAGVGGGSDEREQTLNQILSEMDGFLPNETIIVLAATNRHDVLDAALLRPGRFDRHVVVDRPSWQGRLAILKVHVRNKPLADDVDLEKIARRTIGMSGADLRNLANEAALIATRFDKNSIEKTDFERAYDRIKMGSSRDEPLTDVEKRRTAYHEAGHALCAIYEAGADPLVKVSIIPRGMAGGVTWSQPDEDQMDISAAEMMAKLIMAMGGRAADRMIYGEANSGASQDLKQATRLARMMVTQFGMSDKVGPVAFRTGEEHVFLGKEIYESREYSEGTARLIDEEVQRILREADHRAYELLLKHRAELDKLVDALVVNEELDREEVEKLLGIVRPLEAKVRRLAIEVPGV